MDGLHQKRLTLQLAVFAAPSMPIESRVARRKTRPLQRVSSPSKTKSFIIEYSDNWAGAVWDSYPAVRNMNPSYLHCHCHRAPSLLSLGIDGDTCDTAILQTGIDFTLSDGEVSHDGESCVACQSLV